MSVDTWYIRKNGELVAVDTTLEALLMRIIALETETDTLKAELKRFQREIPDFSSAGELE